MTGTSARTCGSTPVSSASATMLWNCTVSRNSHFIIFWLLRLRKMPATTCPLWEHSLFRMPLWTGRLQEALQKMGRFLGFHNFFNLKKKTVCSVSCSLKCPQRDSMFLKSKCTVWEILCFQRFYTYSWEITQIRNPFAYSEMVLPNRRQNLRQKN